jgi:hypothetical protein
MMMVFPKSAEIEGTWDSGAENVQVGRRHGKEHETCALPASRMEKRERRMEGAGDLKAIQLVYTAGS